MDIERAVEDFVVRGKTLFHHLKSEGHALSDLALRILRTQLHILQVESRRLQNNKQTPAEAPIRSARTAKSPEKCDHGLMIEVCVDANGKRTGQVYCVECGTIFKDPPRRSD